MSDYFECTPVGVEYLDEAPNLFVAEEVVRATPEQIFDVFEDADSWPIWATPIQRVEWTSPKPYEIGTTRSVYMMGGLVGHETFVEWERGKRMAFTFVGSSMEATEKFLEDYRVTDLGDGTCRVQWFMAMQVRGFSRHLMFLTRSIMRWYNRRMFANFRKYAEAYAQRADAVEAA